jgi:hypothetical protein
VVHPPGGVVPSHVVGIAVLSGGLQSTAGNYFKLNIFFFPSLVHSPDLPLHQGMNLR